jgi:hypothetical protein
MSKARITRTYFHRYFLKLNQPLAADGGDGEAFGVGTTTAVSVVCGDGDGRTVGDTTAIGPVDGYVVSTRLGDGNPSAGDSEVVFVGGGDGDWSLGFGLGDSVVVFVGGGDGVWTVVVGLGDVVGMASPLFGVCAGEDLGSCTVTVTGSGCVITPVQSLVRLAT